jgi:F-type H+-transporting ATPase subunit gamma
MASLKDIRARIESTKNTQQITKAMKLVSAAKLRKAQNNITNMRPYALTLQKVIADIAITNKVSHPLMEQKTEVKKVLLVVLRPIEVFVVVLIVISTNLQRAIIGKM